MNTKLTQAVALGALLALAAAPYAAAMDHAAMDHGSMDHGSMGGMHAAAPAPTGAEKPAHVGREIRTAVVNGYKVSYNLIDMKQMMASSSMPMTHDMGQMKSHHLMVAPVGPDGALAGDGKVGFLVVQPDKTEVKTMAMFMEGGYGADVDLVAKGDYKITTKIALAGATLIDEFVYQVK